MLNPRQIMSLIFTALIRVYQVCLSPLLGPSCRYHPTCSNYALDAINQHGPLRGLWLALRRLSRCHPWGGSGYDPVPEPAIHAASSAPKASQASSSLKHTCCHHE